MQANESQNVQLLPSGQLKRRAMPYATLEKRLNALNETFINVYKYSRSTTMQPRMTTLAKRDEIIVVIISQVAPELLMMGFQFRPGSAELASPAVSA